MSESLPKKVMQIVVLIRETSDKREIKEMKTLAEHGVITSLCFYPIRDEHYDEGFKAGELLLIDSDTGEILVHTHVNLRKCILDQIKKTLKSQHIE